MTPPAAEEASWLILAASLPGREAGAARVRLWRSLRDAGAASLRDGVSLIPLSAKSEARLAATVGRIESEGGSAWLFTAPPQKPALDRRLKALFDRAAEYREVESSIGALRPSIAELDEAAARARLRQIDRDLQAVVDHDFFPGRDQVRARKALAHLRAAVDRRFSPAEPSGRAGEVPLRDRAAFQRQRWATRKRLWVDRVASAWLIRRCIDACAEFVWLDRPGDCPRDAHGFDFDGATFTHVGELVTFEVLLVSFDLRGDAGLDGIAKLVHYLDVGGESIAEAAGFEALLSGLRETCVDDDALLSAATPFLDALYRHYSKPTGTRS